MALIQMKGLYKSLLETDRPPNEPAILTNGASKDEKKKDSRHQVKRNNVWCHLALTLNATTLMLMRHDDCVGYDGIEDGAKALKLLHERFQSVETPTLVTLVAQLARLHLGASEILDNVFIRGQELEDNSYLSGVVVQIT